MYRMIVFAFLCYLCLHTTIVREISLTLPQGLMLSRTRGRPRKNVTPVVEQHLNPEGFPVDPTPATTEDNYVTRAELETVYKDNRRLRERVTMLTKLLHSKVSSVPTEDVDTPELPVMPGKRARTRSIGEDDEEIEPGSLRFGERKIRSGMAIVKMVILFSHAAHSPVAQVNLSLTVGSGIGNALYEYLTGTYDTAFYPLAATRLNTVKHVYGDIIRHLRSRASQLSAVDDTMDVYPNEYEAVAEILACSPLSFSMVE